MEDHHFQLLTALAEEGGLVAAARRCGRWSRAVRCRRNELVSALGLRPQEFLAGFISMGTVANAPPARQAAGPAAVWSQWSAREVSGRG